MALNMRKHARKRLKSGLSARLGTLTTQIEADLVQSLPKVRYGHFVHWMRCKFLKVPALPAYLRLSSEQIALYHFYSDYDSTT